jgi:hypothetical protein
VTVVVFGYRHPEQREGSRDFEFSIGGKEYEEKILDVMAGFLFRQSKMGGVFCNPRHIRDVWGGGSGPAASKST